MSTKATAKPNKSAPVDAIVNRDDLLEALRAAQRVAERNTRNPILGHVLLRACGGAVEIRATDLDVTLISSIGATVEYTGSTTAPAQTLADIARKLPGGADVQLMRAPGSDVLEILAGRSRFALQTLPVEEFPATDDDAFDVRFSVEAAELAKLIKKSRFAASTEDIRYYFNGVHFHVAGAGATRTLRAVATDGHRLALVEMPCPSGAERMPPVIVPRKTVGELLKLLDGADEPVEVGVSATRIRFALGRTLLVSRLIDGTFPDYERVIPRDNERIAVLATRPFEQAIDRVATISTEKARPVKLAFETDKVTLLAASSEFGQASEELDCSYTDAPLEICFNARYALDITSEIEGPELRLEMENAAAPAVFRDPSDPSLLFVLMPMRA